MRVAMVSTGSRPGALEDNLHDHVDRIAGAAAAGANLVLFPELSISGYATAPFMRDLAQRLDSDVCRQLCAAASRFEVHVAFGIPLLEGDRRYISHVVVGPSGIVGHYEKIHLARALGEDALFTAGDEFRVFDVDGVRVGINICYDSWHPGAVLTTSHLGAEVVLVPYASPRDDELGTTSAEWIAGKYSFLRQRALDSRTYIVGCNSAADFDGPDGYVYRSVGGALVVGPDGALVAASPDGSGTPHVLIADLDIDRLRRLRLTGAFADRRPDAYVRGLSQPVSPSDRSAAPHR